jgi:hypothetical protein
MPSRRAAVVLAALAALSAACVSDESCSLNGACTAGTCVCVAPWRGADCGELDVLPAATPDGALFRRANVSTWCASTLRDGAGVWHAVLAEFADNCGLDSWTVNSQLVHAASAGGPAGPYANATRLRLPFSHNPKLARAPDGTFLIFHIGCGDNATHRYGPCAGGVTPLPPPPPAVRFTTAAGGCLAPAGGVFPAWTTPARRPLAPLAAAPGAVCAGDASGWLVDRANGRLYSAAWPTAEAYVDCSACDAGAPVTLIGPPPGAAGPRTQLAGANGGFVWNKTDGTLRVSGCVGMCLSNGAPGAHAPCGSNASGEPWSAAQVHVVSCDSADARGWAEARADARGAAAAAAAAAPSPAPPRDCGGAFTELLSSPTLDGPWTFQTAFGPAASGFPASVDNPAPFFFPNGSVAVMFRAYLPFNSTIGIARADSWRGPWTLPTAPIFAGHAEDPFVWFQPATASWHALFHSLGACADVGCHAFSRDGAAWTLSPTPAYGLNVSFADGSRTAFTRRERPQLVLDPDSGAPTHLINGVQPPRALQPAGGRGDASYSLIAPLRT